MKKNLMIALPIAFLSLSLAILAQPVQAEDSINVNVHSNVSGSGHVQTDMHVGARVQGKRMQENANASGTKQFPHDQRKMASTTKIANRAGAEIDSRIEALDKLLERINDMKKVSAADKASLAIQIQTQITAMNDLKAKIAAEATTGTSGLKVDVQSISKSYRIYALVIPRIEILTAADKIMTIADEVAALSVKLQTRITTAQTAGKDVTATVAFMTDLSAKIADAKVQATTARNAIATLNPDEGDATIAASNKTSLKTSRDAIQAARKDIEAARKDAEKIIKAIKAFGIKAASSTADINVNTETHASTTSN